MDDVDFLSFHFESVQKHEKPKTEMGKNGLFQENRERKWEWLEERKESQRDERGIFLSSLVMLSDFLSFLS